MTGEVKLSQIPIPLKKAKLDIPSLPDIVLPSFSKFSAELRTNSESKQMHDQHSSHMTTSDSRNEKSNKIEEKGAAVMMCKRTTTMPTLYSGRNKKMLLNPFDRVPSLFELCLKVLMNNIDCIDEVGGLPYDVLKPVLDRCNAMQLMRIESVNPHLIEDTEHLWEGFCEREFKSSPLRKEPGQSWCEYYVLLCEERDQRLQQLKAKVSQHQAEAESPKRKTKYTGLLAPKAQNRRGSQVPSSSVASQPTFKLSLSKSSPYLDPVRKVKACGPAEAPAMIPSRAEILAKRGLKTLNDPRHFKTQLKQQQANPEQQIAKGVGSNANFVLQEKKVPKKESIPCNRNVLQKVVKPSGVSLAPKSNGFPVAKPSPSDSHKSDNKSKPQPRKRMFGP